MKTTVAFFGGLLMTTMAAFADDGCSKDTDCKGERICVQRTCIEPPPGPPQQNAGQGIATPPPANAAPAGYAPATPSALPPAVAPYGPRQAFDTRHRHFGGFLRPDLGFGYYTTSASANGSSASMSGFAGTFGLAAGGALSENNILAAHLWDTVVRNPTLSSPGFSGTANGDLTMWAFGPEYTHYTADNLYFSISPSLSRLSTSDGSDTDWGFGLRAALGKEWWVSDHWALGAVGHVSFSVNDAPGGNGPTWTSWALTVAFSATYN
jgi:hypothetical protein